MIITDQPQVTSPETPLPATKIDWASIIQQWKSSGLSQPAYCESNNINYNQFTYQNAKLAAKSKAKTSSKLLPVKMTQTHPVGNVQNYFIVHYPNGLKLHIPINACSSAINVLLNCLGEQSC